MHHFFSALLTVSGHFWGGYGILADYLGSKYMKILAFLGTWGVLAEL
jgi:hypothetical protein